MVKPMLMNVWLKSVQAFANSDCFPPGRDIGSGEVEAESQVVYASNGSTTLRIPERNETALCEVSCSGQLFLVTTNEESHS